MNSPSDNACVWAVVVTYRRLSTLRDSLLALRAQTHPLSGIIVVDNANDPAVAQLLQDVWPTSESSTQVHYLGSARNLGGAGGFAWGILTAFTNHADWIWLADDDGRPENTHTLARLLHCAEHFHLDEVSPVVLDQENPHALAFPLRRGLRWRRLRSELHTEDAPHNSEYPQLLPGIASLFNGALFRAAAFYSIGLPDVRLFLRGDEVEMHRRLRVSGMKFGTCLDAGYLHPQGSDEFLPILGGVMHAQYPSDQIKRYFTYRNRGFLQAQRGMRRLIPQEWARFSWFFLITRRDFRGWREWIQLRALGRKERFRPPP